MAHLTVLETAGFLCETNYPDIDLYSIYYYVLSWRRLIIVVYSYIGQLVLYLMKDRL